MSTNRIFLLGKNGEVETKFPAGDPSLGFSSPLTDVGVKTASYTTAGGELIRMDATSGAKTVTLPTAPSNGTRVTVKKVDSSTNAVSVARGGTDVFNIAGGSTSLTLTPQFAAITAQYSAGVWVVTSADAGSGVVYASTAALTGTPTAPTAALGTSTTQISTTAFVQAAITALLNGAPGALDTLKELADAINDDASYAATVTTALGLRLLKASNLSDLASASSARTNLGLGGAAVLAVGTSAGTVAAGDDSRFRAVAGVHTAFAAAGPFSNDTSNHNVGTATTVPLASLSVGSFFRFLIAGTLDTSSSQTPTGTMICKHNINGSQMISGNITVSQTSVYGANQPWQMEGYILVTSMGTAGVGAQVLVAATRWSRSAAAAQLNSYDQAGLVTVDLSSGLAYTTTVNTSTASTFNVVRSLGGFFEHVR